MKRVILDEGVPRRIVRYLPGHDVTTVPSEGWAGVRNGKLLGMGLHRIKRKEIRRGFAPSCSTHVRGSREHGAPVQRVRLAGKRKIRCTTAWTRYSPFIHRGSAKSVDD